MANNPSLRALGVVFASFSLVLLAQADMHFTNRVNDYSVSFSDLQFTNSTFDGMVNVTATADNPGDSFSGADFGIPTGLSFTSWTGDANIQVQNVQDLGTDATADLFDPSGNAGQFNIRFGGNVSAGPGNFFGKYALGGQNVLEVNASSQGFLDDHGDYVWGLYMPGDWSVSGTGLGDHELLGLNAAWSITNDFVYDSGTNMTYFAAVNHDYSNDGDHNVDVSIRLHGSRVLTPEPVTMSLGLAGVGLFVRRRSKAKKS